MENYQETQEAEPEPRPRRVDFSYLHNLVSVPGNPFYEKEIEESDSNSDIIRVDE